VNPGSFIAQYGSGDPPTFVLLAHQVLPGHDNVVEEDLAVGADDIGQEAHLNPGRLEINEEEAYALVLGGLGVRPS
jgi:hypothetical protein